MPGEHVVPAGADALYTHAGAAPDDVGLRDLLRELGVHVAGLDDRVDARPALQVGPRHAQGRD